MGRISWGEQAVGVVVVVWWCGVGGGAWWLGVFVVDTRLSLICAKEPCAESLVLGAISAVSFPVDLFLFVFSF